MTYTWTGPVTGGLGVGGANGVGGGVGGVGGAGVVVVVVVWYRKPDTCPDDFFRLPPALCNQHSLSVVKVNALHPVVLPQPEQHSVTSTVVIILMSF